jgi:ribonuclease G
LVVSQNRHETKVGILEDGQLVEIYLQRANEYSLAGSIHKGRVTRVLPGMQSAFVDLGLERDCFLYVSDFFEENADEIDRIGGDDRGRGRRHGQQNPALIQQAAPSAAVSEVAGIELPRVEGPAPAEGAEPADDSQGRGRGRRSRRRRRGRGFPESKYASEAPLAGASEPGGNEVDEAAESEFAGDAVEEPRTSGEDEEFLVLPGESLSKYRRSAPAPTDAAAEEVAGLTAEEMELAAEAAAEDAAEALLDRVDEIDEREAHSGLVESFEPEQEPGAVDEGPEAAADEEVEDSVDEDELDEVETEVEAEVPEARLEPEIEVSLSAEPFAETAAGAEAPVAADTSAAPAEPAGEAGEEPVIEEEPEGPEPARMPQSLTATLRAQGGRLPHRISRRSRRRRGGRGPEVETLSAPAEPPAPLEERPINLAEFGESIEIARPAREPAPPSPGRPERPEGDRDRGGRGRRDRDRADRGERERERPALPSIAELLKEGQEIIVQIAKEPLGQKGARITSHIALPGRYVVYMPTVDHLGVSRKISTDEERQRLKRILQRHREGVQGGYIMRTAGEGRTEEDIAADMRYLANLWLDIREKAEKRRAPALLHHDVEIVERLLRDQLTEGFKAVWVDNEDLYEQVLHAVERLQPALLGRVKLYTRPEPIFEAFGITQELEKALRPKVWLKSGGYIVINQTEALVAIDINTGKYVGKSNKLEDTIVKTNLEAVKEIVRQLRLRDLGGIIVIDFIDMEERKNRQKVMQALEDAMRADKAPYKVLQFNDFGLVAITRKRVKQSLERALCSPCPYCEGAGYVKSVQTVIGEILTEAQKYAKVVDTKDVVCRANPEVARVLKSTENEYLEELEEILGRPVAVISDPNLHQEKFDLA